MGRQTKYAGVERAKAITRLREWIKPGDTVYTVLDHVSASGMSRHIRVVVPTIRRRCGVCKEDRAELTLDAHGVPFPHNPPDCFGRHVTEEVDHLHPNHAIGLALDLRHGKRHGREQDGLVVGGCGMDMGFHLVYSLSQVLYGGRLVKDIYLDSATHDEPGGQLLTRDGAPEGYVYLGGYKCLGKGKCPSAYHTNHRDRIPCEGTRQVDAEGNETGERCYAPSAWGRYEVSTSWPRRTIQLTQDDGSPGEIIEAGYEACLGDEAAGTLKVCPVCHGAGDVPNPEGPERFDLLHTDGYAIRHRWL